MIVPGDSIGLPATDAAVIEQSWAEPERFETIFKRYFSQIHQYLAARADARGVAPSDDDAVAERVSAAAAGPALGAALARLGRGDRDVLLLVAIAGLDQQEVAQSLGIPGGTVRSRLSRAHAAARGARRHQPSGQLRPGGHHQTSRGAERATPWMS